MLKMVSVSAFAATALLVAGATATPALAQVDLVFSTHVGKNSASQEQYERYFDELKERTDGYVKLKDVFYSQALIKATEQLKGIGDGLADVGYFCTGYSPALLPLTSMAELPYVTEKGDALSAAFADLYENYEPLRQEYHRQNVELLAMDASSPTIIGANKEIGSADDLKGLKVRAYGDLGGIAKANGLVPVPMSTADIYTSLQTGAIGGYFGVPLWMPAPENWLQYTKTIVAPGVGTYYTCGLVMNLDIYEGLPDEVKKTIAEMRREFPAKSIDFVKKGDAATVEKATEMGIGFYRFTPEEVAAWKKNADYEQMVKEWIETRSERTDADVDEFLSKFQDALAKHEPDSTYEQKFPE